MTEQRTAECYACKNAGYPDTKVVLGSKVDGKWTMTDLDGAAHTHKRRKEGTSATAAAAAISKTYSKEPSDYQMRRDADIKKMHEDKMVREDRYHNLFERFIKAYEMRTTVLQGNASL